MIGFELDITGSIGIGIGGGGGGGGGGGDDERDHVDCGKFKTDGLK